MYGTIPHRHGNCAQTVSASAAQRAQSPDDRLRARPRDHIEGACARPPHCGGPDSVLSAKPRRGEKNRREGLGQGAADVLAVSPGMNATHAPRRRRSLLASISAGTKPPLLVIVN